MFILVTRILGVLYALTSLLFTIPVVFAGRPDQPGYLSVTLILPPVLLALLLMVPYARLSRPHRLIGLIVLSTCVAITAIWKIASVAMLGVFFTKTDFGHVTAIVALYSLVSIVILLAQPVAVFYMDRQTPSVRPPLN